MAIKPEEIARLQQLSDEMAQLIEDVDTTSSEATVVYGKIGRTCARALANVAATAAKQTERDKQVQKFQTARQTRKQKMNGTRAQPQAPRDTARSGAAASTTA